MRAVVFRIHGAPEVGKLVHATSAMHWLGNPLDPLAAMPQSNPGGGREKEEDSSINKNRITINNAEIWLC